MAAQCVCSVRDEGCKSNNQNLCVFCVSDIWSLHHTVSVIGGGISASWSRAYDMTLLIQVDGVHYLFSVPSERSHPSAANSVRREPLSTRTIAGEYNTHADYAARSRVLGAFALGDCRREQPTSPGARPRP
jgi:hypothetical protein